MLDDKILRLINNQKTEHTPHAFRAGGAGLRDFGALRHLLEPLTEAELSEALDVIDAMAATHNGCASCTAKIAAFCEAFAAQTLPQRSVGYREACSALSGREQRDYRAEIQRQLGI